MLSCVVVYIRGSTILWIEAAERAVSHTGVLRLKFGKASLVEALEVCYPSRAVN